MSAGLSTKKNGTKYIALPRRTDCRPTCIGGALAMPAATNAASATGGVMNDTMPQYIMNRCTATGSKPAATSGGASTMARKM
ncbi:hypothetical protein D3C83_143130 [compost metagenome]